MSTIKVDTIQSRQHSTSTINLTNTGATVNGDCTATTFSGSGANLTALPAANLTGTLPAIDGSALTGVGGGGYEFVKKIQPSSATLTITEHGLDYDSIYKLVLKHVSSSPNLSYLRFYPHLDNSATKFTVSGSFDTCKHRMIDINGVSSEIENSDHWGFGTGMTNAREFGGFIDFWTGYRCWIIGNTRAFYNDSFVQLYGRKGRVNNTNNDPNQTGTYAKMNGFTLDLNGWDFTTSTELLLYKHKES